jgi:hypothetical protein
VLGEPGDQLAAEKRLHVRLESVGLVLGVDLVVFNVECGGLLVPGLLGRVLDRRLDPVMSGYFSTPSLSASAT